jgi:hypothetical protein
LNAEQLDSLKKSVEKEMQNGAIGVSVGLEYAPDCFTTTDELVEIAKVVKKYGGIYDAHIRDNTGIIHEDGQPGGVVSYKGNDRDRQAREDSCAYFTYSA